MRAIFKRTINSNMDNPSSYFQSMLCVRYSFLSIKRCMQEVLELFPFYERWSCCMESEVVGQGDAARLSLFSLCGSREGCVQRKRCQLSI